MDAYEFTRIVYSRVQSLEPENVSKIMGFLLLQDSGDQEMVRLAFGPDAFLQAVVSRAKKELGLPLATFSHTTGIPSSPRNSQVVPSLFPSLDSSHLSALAMPRTNEYLNAMLLGSYDQQSKALLPEQLRGGALQSSEGYSLLNPGRPTLQDQPSVHDKHPTSFEKFRLYTEQGLRDEHLHDQLSFLNESPGSQHPLNVFPSDHVFPELGTLLNGSKFHVEASNLRSNDKHITDLSLWLEGGAASAWKPCMYYARGYCKHGNNCRFLHSHGRPDTLSPLLVGNGQRESLSNDGLIPASIERLELELQDLLRGQRSPVSIASLPQLYYERYGKTLQAEGYLTESQRHGKAGYSLTKLLARLRDTVTLIDRPHGQHAVVLAEDAHRFLYFRGEKDDLSEVNPGSRQIYLTFPAESTFTEDDVATHFRVYGPVQDVRIPYQQKRMFGFVTFVYSETVKSILAKGNPHYICGARVLVKPYKEKGKHSERKLLDKGENSRYTSVRSADVREYGFAPSPRFFDEHDIFQKQLEEDRILGLGVRKLAELQMLDMQRRLAETSFSAKKATQMQHGRGLDELISSEDMSKATEDIQQLQRSSAFGFILDVLDSDPGEKLELQSERANDDQRSEGHCLPDSPFTSPHSRNKAKTSCLPEEMMSLTLNEKVVGSTASHVMESSEIEDKLTCRICMDILIDPMQLACSHTFCVQCILKVIRVSKEECPLCHQHIGSQIAKLLESRGLQIIIDPSLAKRGRCQSIW
eukprot:c29039_g1_i1 orf=1785-4043(+)